MTNTAVSSKDKIPHKPVHPFLFTILILPMGVASGYVSVTLGYLLSKAGVSVENIAALVAVVLLPHILKFIWAPIVDTTLSFKKWYVISSVVSSLGIIATGILPLKESSLPQLTTFVFLSNLAVTFLCMSTEGLMAYDVPPELKGRAGGFFQAGIDLFRAERQRRIDMGKTCNGDVLKQHSGKPDGETRLSYSFRTQGSI